MPLITQSVSRDYLDAYDGYDQQAVGLGLLDPNIYASPAYQKKKINNLMLGGISSFSYGGAEVDPTPTALVIGYEVAYNTVIAINLRYLTQRHRQSIMKFVLDSNAARIKGNQPIMIDYHSLKRAVPDCQYAVRRYKIVAIALKTTYQLSEWPLVSKEKSPFDGYYMQIKRGK